MALGRRKREQQELWVATSELPRGPGHPFYVKLNELFDALGFDAWVEGRCAAYYAERIGRPGIPPGVYFRMLMIGYFEGLDSQRGIAWRCADSRSLAGFLGYGPTDKTPDHSSLSNTSKRLPLEVHDAVFAFVLKIAREKGLLGGKTVAMDATLIEEAAMDKGYHSASFLADCQGCGIRTYVPERKQRGRRRWTDKPAAYREAVYANRRRVRGERGKRLGRLRSEYAERSFAHMCETGAARRTWLRGLEKVKKRYGIHAAGHNLGAILRTIYGVGTPRSLQSGSAGRFAVLQRRIDALLKAFVRFCGVRNDPAANTTRFDRIFTANAITRAAA